MKKYLLGLFAVVLAVAFSSFSNVTNTKSSQKAFTTYFFTWNGSSYDPITLPTSQLPPTTAYCSNVISDQCDAGFTSINDVDNLDGTHTFSPVVSSLVQVDYRN